MKLYLSVSSENRALFSLDAFVDLGDLSLVSALLDSFGFPDDLKADHFSPMFNLHKNFLELLSILSDFFLGRRKLNLLVFPSLDILFPSLSAFDLLTDSLAFKF